MAAWRTKTFTHALSFRLEINASCLLRGLSEHLRLTAHWMFRSCHFVDKIYWITLVRFFGIIVNYLCFFMLCLLNVASTELIILLNSWCLMIINGFWFWAPVYQNNKVVEGNCVTSSTQSHNLNTKGPLNDIVWCHSPCVNKPPRHPWKPSTREVTVWRTDFMRAHRCIMSTPTISHFVL